MLIGVDIGIRSIRSSHSQTDIQIECNVHKIISEHITKRLFSGYVTFNRKRGVARVYNTFNFQFDSPISLRNGGQYRIELRNNENLPTMRFGRITSSTVNDIEFIITDSNDLAISKLIFGEFKSD